MTASSAELSEALGDGIAAFVVTQLFATNATPALANGNGSSRFFVISAWFELPRYDGPFREELPLGRHPPDPSSEVYRPVGMAKAYPDRSLLPMRRRAPRGADRPLPPGDPDRTEESAEVVVVKIDLALPPSIFFRRLSDAHPKATIEILSRETFPDRSAADVIRFRSPEPVSWWDLLAGMPEVSGLEPLYHNQEEALIRVRHRPWPELASALQRVGLGREYPVVIRGGIGTISVVCRREDLSRLLQNLGTISDSVTLRAVRAFPSPEVDALLTPLQRELLRQAISLGYFEVPRRVSLTELAQQVGKSKSTISRSLSVIERAIVTAAVR